MKKIIFFSLLVIGSMVYASTLNNTVSSVESLRLKPVKMEEFHRGFRRSQLPRCPRCRIYGRSNGGHCKQNDRIFHCFVRR